MHDVYIAAITVGGSLLTGLLVAWATFRVSKAERREQRRRELDDAMSAFLAAISKTVGEMRDMPHISQRHPLVALGRFSTWISDRLVPGRSWASNRRRLRKVMGDNPFRSARQVVDTAARLQVLDPGPELSAAVERSLDYVIALGDDRTPARLDEWSAIHAELREAIASTHRRFLEST